MFDVAVLQNRIPAMSEVAIDNVRQLETYTLKAPQSEIPTSHIIHGGMYARSIMIPAGVVLTGALIKVATVLIVHGDCIVYIGDEAKQLSGYQVFAASAGRKQAFVAKTDTYLTMIFSTDAKTVTEAEEWFTNEAHLLMSRHVDAENHVVVTGE